MIQLLWICILSLHFIGSKSYKTPLGSFFGGSKAVSSFEPAIPSIECLKIDDADDEFPDKSYITSECLEDFIKMISYANGTACKENEQSRRIAGIYIPLNVCVNITEDVQMPSGWPPLGRRKFSCDSKNLMTEACDSIEYSSSFAAITMRPSNGDPNNMKYGWGVCTNISSSFLTASEEQHCVDGQIHSYSYDDDKCSVNKKSSEKSTFNTCAETDNPSYGKSVMNSCNEEMLVMYPCTDDSFKLPGDISPPETKLVTFACKNGTRFDQTISTDYICNRTTNELNYFVYNDLGCSSRAYDTIYELDRKCATLESVYGLQQYSTISSDCVSSYSRMSCFAHDDDWNTYGPDKFVCNATGKNCTSKIDHRPLTLSEVTSDSIPPYKLMFPNVKDAVAGGGKISSTSTTSNPSDDNSGSSNTEKIVAVVIAIGCLALAGGFFAYYYFCAENKSRYGSVQSSSGYEAMNFN